ncbi:MAG TPA: nuclear transport factor 2 family protein [Jatrophihabitans sp.]|uniref:nuclear transport factor 2 family protein n=1 Tax=Jatrophihabitans sp. TaxID=1932789 RepID=UPI002E0046D7|nr:nuclear transport factor 2 family protein [Jatrophihabitans sp.]
MSERIENPAVLPTEIRVLLDKQAITELLTRYLRAIDRGDIATLRACYLTGATEEHGGLYRGSAQGYIDTIEAGLTHPRAVGTHALSNVLVEVDGDRAQSEHYVLAMTRARAADGEVKDSLIASRIVDDLERVDGRWGIARRRLRFDWAQDLAPRPDRWLWGRLDPADLLHGEKYPTDLVYDGITTAPRSAADGE